MSENLNGIALMLLGYAMSKSVARRLIHIIAAER
ncbi:Uncharacterised protein [Metakosakonia massiliensis]|uniref:Uncharacterized protein n=1 Tax=Phytobacter massiliensis TaxID=1485952 RepID=A0A6N3D6A9_9ENTR